jgi:hypothetical protein
MEELLCCGEVVGCRRKEVGEREKAFVGDVAADHETDDCCSSLSRSK